VQGGEGGRLFPANGARPRIITADTPDAASVFSANVQVGYCHWDELGLEAAYRALSEPLLTSVDDPRTPEHDDGNAGFLRDDARLALVFVTDEQDFSPRTPAFYETHLRALKGNRPSQLRVSAIVGPEDLSTCPSASSSGSRYRELVRATGGVEESICSPDWASSLRNISFGTFGPTLRFPLAEEPGDLTSLRVLVNGLEVTGGFTYDAVGRAVVFAPDRAPPPSAVIELRYPIGCR
jgi:hypothetical protein